VSSELISPWLVGVGAPPTRTDPGAALGPSSGAPAPFRSESSNGAVHLVEPKSIGGTRALEEIEREAILAALDRFEGHRQKTARALKIGVRTLGLKLKKWKQDGILPMTA
jgi:DNA-binding NtrC family response regulator